MPTSDQMAFGSQHRTYQRADEEFSFDIEFHWILFRTGSMLEP